jgi:hypothetical protein
LSFLDTCFDGKERLSLESFSRINENVSSEMLLSIMTILQDRLPCSENFYRFKNNYDKFMEKKSGQQQHKTETRRIASPRLINNLSPVNMIKKKSGELKTNFDFSMESDAQKSMLQHAAG